MSVVLHHPSAVLLSTWLAVVSLQLVALANSCENPVSEGEAPPNAPTTKGRTPPPVVQPRFSGVFRLDGPTLFGVA
jgi:hypothetical protein